MKSENDNIKNRIIRMCRTISEHYVRDVNRKVSRLIDNDQKFVQFKVGDKCLVYFPITTESTKLFSRWKGLYEVSEVLDFNTYTACDVNNKRKRFIVPSNRIRPLSTTICEDKLSEFEGGKNVEEIVENDKIEEEEIRQTRIQPSRVVKKHKSYKKKTPVYTKDV